MQGFWVLGFRVSGCLERSGFLRFLGSYGWWSRVRFQCWGGSGWLGFMILVKGSCKVLLEGIYEVQGLAAFTGIGGVGLAM